jgi:uncharacterized protein YggE
MMVRKSRVPFSALFLTLLTSGVVAASTEQSGIFTATGKADIKCMPDTATISFPVTGQGDNAQAAVAATRTRAKAAIDALRAVSAAEVYFPDDGDLKATQADSTHFAAREMVRAHVHDFDKLPDIVKVLTGPDEENWSIKYSLSAGSDTAEKLNQNALDDATRKAEAYARDHGFSRAYAIDISDGKTCYPMAEDSESRCQEDGVVYGDPALASFAPKPPEPRTDFSIPKPQEQEVEAVVKAMFELR